jgi:hypothetical protein
MMLSLLLGSALVLSVSGCGYYYAPVMPPTGMAFSSVSGPMDIDAETTKVSPKMGESSSICVLGLFAFGDASVDAASRNGNLSNIEYLDYKYLNVLGFFQSFTTRAYGE